MNIVFDEPSERDLLDASSVKFVAVRVLPLIVNPAIFPPVSETCEPVICPLDFNIKLSLLEFICVDAISNPPIVPPLNNTFDPVISPVAVTSKLSEFKTNVDTSILTSDPLRCAAEAVICPEDFSLSASLDDLISAEFISKFAIVPAEFAVIVFAVMSPVIFAEDAVI